MGHIRALEENLEAVGLDRDFEARYQFLATKAKAIKQIKDAAAHADTVYLASDDDREGEAISYAVALLLRLPIATTPRIVFHEITKSAIKAAVQSPRVIDMNRVAAQQARSILDLLVGFTISPLLWKHVAPSLSAGRCQTPALRLVVERETAITSFKSASSWRIQGTWLPVLNGPVSACEAQMEDELEDEESALNYLENIGQPPSIALITSAATKAWSSSPPPPLITSTLQQQASALFHINPKTTMQAAQRLYEQGYITYMRTDKAVLSEEAQEAIRSYISTTYGQQFVGSASSPAPAPTKAKAKTKAGAVQQQANAQEAHEAIRPTTVAMHPLPPDVQLSAIERKIYSLVWQRSVQSQMAAATGETFSIQFTVNACPDFPWSANWRRTLFPGWQKVGRVANIDEEDGEEKKDSEESAINFTQLQTAYAVGTELKWKQLQASPHETRQPPRYTEATLIRELEKNGIGRPSTFATLVAAIQDKSYVELKNFEGKKLPITTYSLLPGQWPPSQAKTMRNMGAEKQKLAPTDLGRTALAFLLEHFNDLFAYEFTGQIEERLDRIAEGQESHKQILRDMWASYKDRYEALKGARGTTVASPDSRQKLFSDGLKAVVTKKGPLLLTEHPSATKFHGWPPGDYGGVL